MPERIQLSRLKGWRMPPNTVKVDRSTKYGNPHKVGEDATYYAGPGFACITPAQAVALFRDHCAAEDAADPAAFRARMDRLAGHDLACWCRLVDDRGAYVPCHADVLLELANAPKPLPDPPGAG